MGPHKRTKTGVLTPRGYPADVGDPFPERLQRRLVSLSIIPTVDPPRPLPPSAIPWSHVAVLLIGLILGIFLGIAIGPRM